MTTLAAVQDKIAGICRRMRQRPRGTVRPWAGPRRCGICDSTQHTRPRCAFAGLALWTDGDAIVIAKSAAEACAVANDPLGEEFAEMHSAPEAWHVMVEEPVVLRPPGGGGPVRWRQRWWIVGNGPKLLAVGGELMPGSRWDFDFKEKPCLSAK